MWNDGSTVMNDNCREVDSLGHVHCGDGGACCAVMVWRANRSRIVSELWIISMLLHELNMCKEKRAVGHHVMTTRGDLVESCGEPETTYASSANSRSPL